MRDQTGNDRRQDRPTLTWVEVQDAHGGVHLEARWTVEAMVPAARPVPGVTFAA